MGRDGGLVDVRVVEVVRETSAAWGVKVVEDEFGKEAEVHWLPKSKCENNGDNTFTMPQWLAEEKGLEDHVE